MALKLYSLLLFLHLFSITKAQSPPQSNITTGSTLYTNSTPNFWPSPSGYFAFGFYPSGNGFKVGIWLVGSPKNTIVWMSHQNDTVLSPGATLLFSTDGRLRLHSSTGQVESIAKTNQKASVASMLDSGNFVLYDSSWNIIWASFDYPSNTLLVGQKLGQDQIMYSSISEADTSIGSFKLWMQRDGNLNAYPIRSIFDGRYVYWSSNNTHAERNSSLNLAADSRIYLSNSFGLSVMNLTEGGYPVDVKALYRVTFDVDGILRLYQHQMGLKGSSNYSILWTTIQEEDRCRVKGICGPNSICTINDADVDVSCICLPGFDFVDSENPNIGCKLLFAIIEDCFGNKGNADYTIFPLPNTLWEPSEYDILLKSSEEACSKDCLEDCNCVVAKFSDQMCIKQKLPIRFGRRDSSNPTKALVKIRNESLPNDLPTDTNVVITKKLGKKLGVVGVVLITFSIIFFLLSSYLIFSRQIWSSKINTRQASSPPDVVEEISLRSFTYDQLVIATDNFKEEIGRGASAKVYKGTLAMNGGREIAVKWLLNMVEGEPEFRNEMKIIGRTHHKNLVHLIGFCSEGSSRLLVYEFMKNGSLGSLLFNARERPSWNERMRISLEIARGIHYLHEECQTRIIHCDIKPQNILMDESWSAKISDFGLSKLLKTDQTRTYTMARGTRGYVAPEWYKRNSAISVKADIYSFGVLLFEIICCRKNMVLSAPEEEIVLMDWIDRCYVAGELRKVVGEEVVDMEELEKMVKVGLWCVQTEPDQRLSMKSVILMLEGTIVTQPPPPPCSYASV